MSLSPLLKRISIALAAGVAVLGATARAADPPAFAASVGAAAGSNPVDVLVADFDNDGKPDVCTADSSAGQVSIRLGTGTGTTFRATTGFATGTGLTDIAWGHFNGDALPDLVTVEDGGLVVALNQGVDPGNADAVLFSRASTPITLNGTTFQYVNVADMDGDTKADLVTVGNTGADTGFAGVYQGDGHGSFPSSYGSFGTRHYGDFTVGDVTRDGFADVLICSPMEGFHRLVVLRSFGATIGFDQEYQEIVAYTPTGVALADLSGDGVPEALVVGYGRFQGNANEIGVSVLYNTAAENSTLVALNFLTGFQVSNEIGGETELYPAMAVGDFDLDGDADVAVADPLTTKVAVLRFTPQKNPGGAFVGLAREDLTEYQVAQEAWRMVAAKLESPNDATADLVTAHQNGNGISILRNTSVPGGVPQLELASALKVDSEEVTVKLGQGHTLTGYRSGNKMTFFTTVPVDVPGLSVRPQSSVLPPITDWINVPGAIMTFKQKGDTAGGVDTKDFGPGWYGTTTEAPDGELWYRVICKAPGYHDSAATTAGGPTGYIGPVRVLPGPARLKTELTFDPDTGPGVAVKQGQTINGRLTVTNSGGTAASGVFAAATIPAGCSLVSASPSASFLSLPGIVPMLVWSVAGKKAPAGFTVLGHETKTFDFVLSVDASATPGSDLVCVAGAGNKKVSKDIVAALTGGPASDLIQTSQPLTVESQLKVIVSVDNSTRTAGQVVHFRFRMINEAPFALNGVTAHVTVPAGTAFDVAQYLDEFGDPIGGNDPIVDALRKEVTWNLPNLAANGGETTVVLGVRVKYDHDVSPVVLDSFVFSGTAATDGHGASSAAKLATKSVDVTVLEDDQRPHLRAGQFVITGRLAVGNYVACLPGDEITVHMFAKNEGVVGLERATLEGYFPFGTGYTAGSFLVNDVAVDPHADANGRFEIALGDLAPGQRIDLAYMTTVLTLGETGAAQAGQYLFVEGPYVRSSSLIEPTVINGETLKILKPVEFEMSVTATGAGGGMLVGLEQGDTVTHTWTVTNRGQVSAAGVQGVLSLPPGFKYVSSTVNGDNALSKPKKGKYPILIPPMAPGATVTVTLTSNYETVPKDNNDGIVHVLDVTGGQASAKPEKPAGTSSAFVSTSLAPESPRLFSVIISQSVGFKGREIGYSVIVGNLSSTTAAKDVFLAAGVPFGAKVATIGDGGKEFVKDGKNLVAWGVSSLVPKGLLLRSFSVVVPEDLQGCSMENLCITGGTNASNKVSGVVGTNIRGTGSYDSFVFDEVACVVAGRGLPSVTDDPPHDFLERISEYLTKSSRFNAAIGGADFLTYDNGTAVIPFPGNTVMVIGNPNSLSYTSNVTRVENGAYKFAYGPSDEIFHFGLSGFQNGISVFEAMQRSREALDNFHVSVVGNGGGNIFNGSQTDVVLGSPVVLEQVKVRINVELAIRQGNAIVAAGGGNVLLHNGAGVVSNDGAGAKPGTGIVAAGGGNAVAKSAGSIVAGGGGNIVAGGGGNIVAAGGGNIVAGGGGNIVAGGGGN